MAQPHNRVFNFSAGPSTLPVDVLEDAREGLLNYKGTGMSVMEMSHRSKPFETIIESAEADLRQLMGVPEEYHVMFLQGGASLQFSMIPMTFLGQGQVADYVTTGTWGKKAQEAAQMAGNVNVLWDGKPNNYSEVPDLRELNYAANAAYIYFTSNETIQGVQFKSDPDLPAPTVCDMSSDILSRPLDVSKYAMLYAGAQKNMGPSGVTLVVMSPEMMERVPQGLQPMLDYRLLNENKSLYNTPPTWAIYICGLVYARLLRLGGLEEAQRRNREKAQIVYDAIDGSGGFYRGHAAKEARSDMNVTFTLADDELTGRFVKEAEAVGLDGLKGHRSVGGCRASIYNAFPKEGCERLAEFMREFAAKNG
jgi:phosphoserine aminotransferase